MLYDRGGRKGDHRVVLGAVSPAPLRRNDLEKILASGSLDEAMIKKLQLKIGEGANVLSQNGYKVPMLRGLIAQGVRIISGRKEG